MKWSENHFDYILIVLLSGFLILHFTGLTQNLDDQALFILAFVGTLPVLWSAAVAVWHREVSIDLLASIALGASLVAKEWPSAVFINLMLASARIFARYTDGQARRAIQSLLKLRPQKTKVRRDGSVSEVAVESVNVGDTVIIESGERVPVDGVIIKGTASIDQSSLTGESIPVSKEIGDRVLSSTLNLSGTLEIKAEKVGKDTTLAKIIQLVETAQSSKAGIHTLADKFTTAYISLALIGSAVIYYFTGNLNLVLALLLVACADDIAVALPLAFLAAIGAAAKQGIIIKGGEYLESLTKLKTLLLDKTGTLTSGKLKVQSAVPFGNISQNDLLKYASAVECLSDHPAAKAIIDYAQKQDIMCPQPEEFHEIPGKGSVANWQGHEIVAGKLSFIEEKGISISDHQKHDIELAKNQGLNTTLFAYDGNLAGFFCLADELRPEIIPAIKDLKSLGVQRFIMLTGDNEKVADKIAAETGITEYHANLMPEDKLKYIRSELNKKTTTAMVGDGVNDAAALALADIGIAMGAIGSDAAIETADIALMKDDFSKIASTVRLGRYTMRIANQDFAIWAVVNVIGFALVLSNTIGPQGAAAYNFLTDFLPFFNSLRLFRLHRAKVF